MDDLNCTFYEGSSFICKFDSAIMFYLSSVICKIHTKGCSVGLCTPESGNVQVI